MTIADTNPWPQQDDSWEWLLRRAAESGCWEELLGPSLEAFLLLQVDLTTYWVAMEQERAHYFCMFFSIISTPSECQLPFAMRHVFWVWCFLMYNVSIDAWVLMVYEKLQEQNPYSLWRKRTCWCPDVWTEKLNFNKQLTNVTELMYTTRRECIPSHYPAAFVPDMGLDGLFGSLWRYSRQLLHGYVSWVIAQTGCVYIYIYHECKLACNLSIPFANKMGAQAGSS